MTTIYFVRHALPDLSVHDDTTRPLSLEGTKDCQKVITYFQNIAIDRILSSPFKRAHDTVLPLAHSLEMTVTTIDDLRERKVSDDWLADFSSFAYNQWQDFSFKLEKGESLKEVQVRNIQALETLLGQHPDETLVIGTHGTALSTIINYYDWTFGFEEFNAIKSLMPWIVKMTFADNKCLTIDSFAISGHQPFAYNRVFD